MEVGNILIKKSWVKIGKMFFYLLTFLPFYFFMSCTRDFYDKGEGELSYMRGDFAEAYVNSSRQITRIVTDDGDDLALTAPFLAKWAEVSDTTYRCRLYYNKVGGKAEVLSIGEVPCLDVIPLSKFDEPLRTDPVTFQSTWMSKNGRYLNVGFMIKSGVTNDTAAIQSIGLVTDTIITNPDNKKIRHLILHHNQNNVPEYYSTQAYVSVPTEIIDADSVRISINSYDGEVVVKHRVH